MLHLLKRVFSGEVLKDHQPLPEILILVLQLEDLCILVVNELGLLLDGLSQAEVPLQHLLHHIYGVDDAARDGVLGLIGCIVTETTLGDNSARCADPFCINSIDLFPRRDTWLVVVIATVLQICPSCFLRDGRVLSLQYLLTTSSIVLTRWSELPGIASVRPSDPA